MPFPTKGLRCLGALAAVGVAGALVVPSRTEAWTTIGGSLGLSQRDFRVFNNFTDPTANDNVTPDPNFPGYVGAPLAAWKAYVEWASRLHGDGNGDPHQVGGLGSGGANFDPSWQGLAGGVGGVNDNVISEISGQSGATLAFCELPISDGWSIRVYADAAIWNDGPTTPNSHFDLQGILCHELGHALGLGHSDAGGNPTMIASAIIPGVNQRSIASDDIAGVQAIYGAADFATKPIISGISTAPGQLTIDGLNFGNPGGNEVWFTKTGTGGDGTPVKMTSVPSNGTQIVVVVPATAGPGDVLVKIPGTTNDKLSNPWPFQPIPCPPVFNSCSTSPNSVNAVGAVMAHAGSQSIASNDLVLISSGCPPNTSGLFYYGANPTFATFGNGFRCIGSPTFRLGVVQANVFGDAVQPLDIPNAPGFIGAGQTKYFQFWYRNPAGGGAGFNLSDSLGVPFCP